MFLVTRNDFSIILLILFDLHLQLVLCWWIGFFPIIYFFYLDFLNEISVVTLKDVQSIVNKMFGQHSWLSANLHQVVCRKYLQWLDSLSQSSTTWCRKYLQPLSHLVMDSDIPLLIGLTLSIYIWPKSFLLHPPLPPAGANSMLFSY